MLCRFEYDVSGTYGVVYAVLCIWHTVEHVWLGSVLCSVVHDGSVECCVVFDGADVCYVVFCMMIWMCVVYCLEG